MLPFLFCLKVKITKPEENLPLPINIFFRQNFSAAVSFFPPISRLLILFFFQQKTLFSCIFCPSDIRKMHSKNLHSTIEVIKLHSSHSIINNEVQCINYFQPLHVEAVNFIHSSSSLTHNSCIVRLYFLK